VRTDQAVVNAIALASTDLPGAWTPGSVQERDNSGDAQMSHCLGIPNSDPAQTAYAGSPRFKQGATEIFSETQAFRSDAVVQSDLGGFRQPQLARCLAQLLTSSGATNVRISKIALPNTVGALSGFRLTGSLDPPRSSGSGPIVIDEVGLAKGRIETAVHAVTTDASLPAGALDRAIAALAQKLDDNVS
jgi:hypothetical protein